MDAKWWHTNNEASQLRKKKGILCVWIWLPRTNGLSITRNYGMSLTFPRKLQKTRVDRGVNSNNIWVTRTSTFIREESESSWFVRLDVHYVFKFSLLHMLNMCWMRSMSLDWRVTTVMSVFKKGERWFKNCAIKL